MLWFELNIYEITVKKLLISVDDKLKPPKCILSVHYKMYAIQAIKALTVVSEILFLVSLHLHDNTYNLAE